MTARACFQADSFSRRSLDDELRRIGSRFAAGQADSGTAWCREGQIVRTIACDVGGHINGDPRPLSKRAARSQHTADWRRYLTHTENRKHFPALHSQRPSAIDKISPF